MRRRVVTLLSEYLLLVLGEYLLDESENLTEHALKLDLIEIMPIEYHYRSHLQRQIKLVHGHFQKIIYVRKNPRLQIYWNYTFSRHLTQAVFDGILKDFKQKDKVKVSNNLDRFITYQFVGKPQIYLDKLTGKIYVTRGTLNYYSKQHCQQQAGMIMRILRGTKRQREIRPAYANFLRTSVTCNPDRIGRTKEERQIYFEAVMDLFNDKPKARLKKIREAAHAK